MGEKDGVEPVDTSPQALRSKVRGGIDDETEPRGDVDQRRGSEPFVFGAVRSADSTGAGQHGNAIGGPGSQKSDFHHATLPEIFHNLKQMFTSPPVGSMDTREGGNSVRKKAYSRLRGG
jgi:hypothetical protein